MIRKLVLLALASAALLDAAKFAVTQPGEIVTAPRSSSARTALLFAFATNQSGFDTEITLSNTSQDTFGSTPGSGACTLYLYGSPVPSANPQTSVSIAAGQQIVFNLSSGGGGMAGAPGFQGYIVANCAFPLARGLAKIFALTTGNGLAYSQDAQVLTLPRGASHPQYLLFPFVNNQNGYDTGIAISNTSQDPFGTSPSAGSCTLNFYGANPPASQPVPMPGTGASGNQILAGSTSATLVSSLAPNFQGYVIASCDFPDAAGSGFSIGVGTRKVMWAANPELLALPRASGPSQLLFSFGTNQNGANASLAIANTSLDPLGTVPVSGACTLNFHGPGSLGPLITPAIPAGTAYSFSLSQFAPGFQGYVSASCGFPQARGTSALATGGFTRSDGSNPVEGVSLPGNSTPTGLLFSAVSNANGNDTSIVISNTSEDPFGASPASGPCTISYFGSVGGSGAPSPQVSASIPAGSQLSFTLSQGNPEQGIAATPGFSGYLMASCGFPPAHGLATITQSGPALAIAKSHSGNFSRNQAGATGTVSNQRRAQAASGATTLISPSSPFTCNATVAVAPTLRAEGASELLGDFVLTCAGGNTSQYTVGSPLPVATITLTLGTNVTSRLLNTSATPNVSEALLLIDEPGSGLPPVVPGTGPQAPQTVCSSATAGAGAGGCVQYPVIVNDMAVMSGSPTTLTAPANVYQGVWDPAASNQIAFVNVPILVPGGSGGTRIFRITNVRANAAGVGGGGLAGTVLNAAISISSSTSIPIGNPFQTAGFVQTSLAVSLRNLANTGGLSAPSFSACAGESNVTPTAIVQFSENFSTAWRTRVQATSAYTSQGGFLSGSAYAQNIPGTIYNAESGFILSTPSGSAGLTDYGTRLKATFHNVPAGVRLFVSVNNVTNSSVGPGGVTSAALMSGETAGDTSSVAGFPAVAATTTVSGIPVAEVIPDGTGTAQAVWEITATNPFQLETASFVVYQLFTPASAGGLATVNLFYAPTPPAGSAPAALTAWGDASGALTLPRFFDLSTALNLFSLTACQAPTLTIAKSHSGNFTQDQQGATYTLTVSNAASAGATSGTVTVTDTAPSGLTLVSMAGTGWSCAANVCTRPDSLAAGASYPPITVTVNVAPTAPSPEVNTATVSGGGSALALATDNTVIAPVFSVGCSALSFTYTTGGLQPPTEICTISNPDNLALTATSNAPWLTATPSGNSLLLVNVSPLALGAGTYSGTVTVSAAGANPVAVAVTITITGGLTFSPSSNPSVPAAGASGNIAVTASGSWSAATNNPDFITLNSPAADTCLTGNGTISYTVAANTGAGRTGSITVLSGCPGTGSGFAVGAFPITQLAAAACTQVFSGATPSFTFSGGIAGNATVSFNPQCASLTPSGFPSWVTITNPVSCTNANCQFTFSAQPNNTATIRTGTITLGSATILLAENALVCTYSVATASGSSSAFPAGGGSGSIQIATAPAGAACSWTIANSNPSLIQNLSAATGTGSATVTYSVPANTQAAPQAGVLSVIDSGADANAGQGVQYAISQAPAGATYNCTVGAPAVRTLRPEGISELLADLLLTCSGTSTGGVTGDIIVTLNTSVTNHALTSDATGDTTDALVLMDEPASQSLLLSGSGQNVFRGVVAGPQSIRFPGVRLAPDNGSFHHTFRVTNLRADANRLANRVTGMANPPGHPTDIVATVSIAGAPFTLTGASETAGTVPYTLNSGALAIPPSSTLTAGTPVAGGPVGYILQLTFAEQTANVYRPKIAANQNPSQTGVTYLSESGYVNSQALGTETGFSNDDQWSLASAGMGTRLVARLSAAQCPATVYVPFNPVTNDSAQLVSADSSGAGGFPEVAGNALGIAGYGYQPVTLYPESTGACTTTVTWEVIAPPANSPASLMFNLYLASPTAVTVSNANSSGLGPQVAVSAPSSSAPVPRFGSLGSAAPPVLLGVFPNATAATTGTAGVTATCTSGTPFTSTVPYTVTNRGAQAAPNVEVSIELSAFALGAGATIAGCAPDSNGTAVFNAASCTCKWASLSPGGQGNCAATTFGCFSASTSSSSVTAKLEPPEESHPEPHAALQPLQIGTSLGGLSNLPTAGATSDNGNDDPDATSPPPTSPILSLSQAFQGSQPNTIVLTVYNSGSSADAGSVMVIDAPSNGLTIASMAGYGQLASNWTCNLPTRTCTYANQSLNPTNQGSGPLPQVLVTYTAATNAANAVQLTYYGNPQAVGQPNPLLILVPVIGILGPGSATSGGASFTLTVNGSNFAPGAQVYWNQTLLVGSSTCTNSSTQLCVTVPGSLIATPGSANITVQEPFSMGGASSSPVSFNIAPPSLLAVCTPSPLSFSYTIGGAAPAAETCSLTSSPSGLSVSISVTTSTGGNWLSVSPNPATTPFTLTLAVNISGLTAGTYGALVSLAPGGSSFPVLLTVSPPTGLAFYPVTPCRVADTRSPAGPFGGPIMAGGSTRSFAIPSSTCNIPSTAQAYSLNFTVVPSVSLTYLTAWPTGQSQPLVSTLNSLNGAVLANAAIVPAGAASTGGAVSIYVSDATHVIIDINGYFAPRGNPGALAFYPAGAPSGPCRVADTRSPNGPFGGPSLGAGGTRSFAVPASNCAIPATAQAYSLNMTVVPPGPLTYLTVWPTGQTQPFVSTLNALQGQIVANAAIVPAGAGTAAGAISVFASDPTNVIVDINGYFAPPGAGGLYFYPVTPCRIADTRNPTGTFGGPPLGDQTTRNFPIPTSACGLPSTAQAWSLNMTVVPSGPLTYLTTWPAGQPQPNVSTLNSLQGQILANAAIVPAGGGPSGPGAISVYVSDPTNLIIDVNGYFGQ